MSENKRVTIPFLEKVLKPIVDLVHTKADKKDVYAKTELANVAVSGSYTDLTNTPTLAAVATSGAYADLNGTPELAAVATSGSYTDLSDVPVPDVTLSVEGAAADAKAVGDALAETGVWYVHATANDDGPFTLDKTYDEIIAAYDAGRKVQCEMRFAADAGAGAYIFDLITFGPYVPDVNDGDTVYNGALFVLWMQNRMMRMLVTTDNQVMMFQTNRFQTEGELQIRYGNELMYAGHMGVDVDIDLNIPINAPKDYVAFTDQVNGYIYYVSMRNGTLVSTCAIETIEVASMPTTVEYTAGDVFDPSGLTLRATRYDGTPVEVTDFTYDAPEMLTEDVTAIPVTYTDMGVTYTVDVPITVNL